jgi:hypothetical protein
MTGWLNLNTPVGREHVGYHRVDHEKTGYARIYSHGRKGVVEVLATSAQPPGGLAEGGVSARPWRKPSRQLG